MNHTAKVATQQGLRPLPRLLGERQSFGEIVNHAANVATQKDLGLSPGYLASARSFGETVNHAAKVATQNDLGLSPGYLASAKSFGDVRCELPMSLANRPATQYTGFNALSLRQGVCVSCSDTIIRRNCDLSTLIRSRTRVTDVLRHSLYIP